VDRPKFRLIGRGDLLAALNRAAAAKVTVISAPADSGKTSLLRAWVGRPGQPHRLAVVQVQRDQHHAQQFWLALLGAVRGGAAGSFPHAIAQGGAWSPRPDIASPPGLPPLADLNVANGFPAFITRTAEAQ
jgi:hypothetical protein